MKLLTLLLAGAFGLLAQSLNFTVSPTSGVPGSTVNLTLTYVDTVPSSTTAAAQFTLTLPSGLVDTLPGTGGLAPVTVQAKELICGPAQVCLLGGFGATENDNALTNGTILTLPIQISATAPVGPLVISPTAATAVTTANSQIALAVNSVTINVIPCKYCITGDSVVSSADVAAAVSQADGTTACTNGDVNGDGKCNIVDVELVLFNVPGIQ